MIERKLGAVLKFAVSLVMTNVTGVVKQCGDKRHLGAPVTKSVGRFDAALITHYKPRHGQRHV